MLRFNTRVQLNRNLNRSIQQRVDRAQMALDEQVLKDSNYFIPARDFILRDSSITHSQIGKGKIIWQTPYARRLYYNPQYNFSKDKNPNSQGLWFEAAKSRFRNDWVRIAQRIIDEG